MRAAQRRFKVTFAHEVLFLIAPKTRNESRCMKLASESRFDYLLVGSRGISEPLPVAGSRLGRRTARTLPLFPPPQKN